MREPEAFRSRLLTPSDRIVLQHDLEFKIGRHTFQVVDPAVEKLPFWERPISRRKFLGGAAVGAAGVTTAAVGLAGTNPFMRLIRFLSEGPFSDKAASSFAQRVAIGAYPLASWRQSQGREVVGPVPKTPVHFVPHEALADLGHKSGVRFSGNSVFIRLNQDSQQRWMRQPGNGFFTPEERDDLRAMVQAGVRPHFVLEPTEGLYNVPKYHATLDSIAKDVSEFGPATLQFAPGLNSPRSPYYWKENKDLVQPLGAVREAFRSVHAAFGGKANVSVVFSPLLPHDPALFSAQADEISLLAQTVKPYVSGAGGLFYPNSLQSVDGLNHYADVLKRHHVPFVGLDGFAARGAKPFEESLKRFKDPRISERWKYLNFSDVPNTLVEPGNKVSPWTLTSEKMRLMGEHLAK
ncbi:twin-arginine translocation signal domain-containing protein [Candidatus Micrarchaeota archaeon]|nr:twin-arginine translocation signal domain-containing protein [Candidatus Micrarchaeota archaeon]